MAADIYPRFVQRRVANALSDTRIVLLSGPRQSGKTTLARLLSERGMAFHSLDNLTTLSAARQDPVGFVRGVDRAIIDEIQRVPELLLAIKESVDIDQRPGRFLLTGSANLMTAPHVADSLAGRMETVQLLPLAQSELKGRPSKFLERVFGGLAPEVGAAVLGPALVSLVLAGGYPEALTRTSWRRRTDWYRSYIDALVQRDVRDVAHIEQVRLMPRLLRVLSQHAGQLVNYSGVGAPLALNHVTTRKYVDVFELLLLVTTLQPWHTSALKRLTKTPKLHFLDSGLLAALCEASPERVQSDRRLFDPLLETFVLAELLKLASWADDRFEFFHFRDKERHEVDIVIEDTAGRVVGIEVKASATVGESDLGGLRRLSAACGQRFVLGLILYDHDRIVPLGDRLLAAPISTLWQ
jgi:uncharacterized protein